jgi:alpha-beta hydrolase superfamily lysophospholipase
MSTETSDQTKPTIVLIHGLWMTPRSWEHWIDRYKSRGHEVLTPAKSKATAAQAKQAEPGVAPAR